MENTKQLTLNDGTRILAFENGFCPLANHHWSPFTVRGQKFCNVLQYVESKKAYFFGDYEIRDEIMKSKSAKEISRLGQVVKGFDSEEWAKFEKEHLFDGINAKMDANKKIAAALKATGDIKIVYANRHDRVLGTGCDMNSEELKNKDKWEGHNVLGELLMQKRKRL